MKTVNIQRVAIALLVPAPVNANRMTEEDHAALVRAMMHLGVDLQPPLVRPLPGGRYEIVDGHHRVEAAKQAGATHMLVAVCALTDEEAQLLGLGMNRVRGEIDLGVASDVLRVLVQNGANADLLALSGFNTEEMEALLAAHEDESPSPVASFDDEEETPTSLGQFVLEVAFDRKDDMGKVRRAVKRAAGKGGTLAQGLLRLIEED